MHSPLFAYCHYGTSHLHVCSVGFCVSKHCGMSFGLPIVCIALIRDGNLRMCGMIGDAL